MPVAIFGSFDGVLNLMLLREHALDRYRRGVSWEVVDDLVVVSDGTFD